MLNARIVPQDADSVEWRSERRIGECVRIEQVDHPRRPSDLGGKLGGAGCISVRDHHVGASRHR